MKNIILAVVSDLHVGSTVGLCPPIVELDDGGKYKLTKAQKWLWEKWLDYWKSIGGLKKKYKAEVWVVVNGDMFDGDHHQTMQIWSSNPADWMNAADSIFKEIGAYKHFFIVRGTECHTGKSGNIEEMYAKRMNAEKDVVMGTHSWFELPLEASGVRMLFRHHGSVGMLPWTFANIINRQAVEEIIKKINGEHDAELVIQSHRHKFGESGMNYPLRLVHTPAWQLRSAWGYSKPGLLSDLGGLAIICQDGKYSIEPFIYKAEKREVWKEK